MEVKAVTNYRDMHAASSRKAKLRSMARDALIFSLSLKGRPCQDGEWIRFPYYHHVFDDERDRFEKQLRYMRNPESSCRSMTR